MVNNEVYHVYNRGVNKRPIFTSLRDHVRATETYHYYLSSNPPVRYSIFKRLSKEMRKSILEEMNSKPKNAVLIAYCLMPNHYHFLLRQLIDNGISEFLRNFQISYTKYFNKKHDRIGPLLQGPFKSVHIEGNDQLIHVTRYIHLNPLTSYLVKDFDRLLNYNWSSLQEYLGLRKGICNNKIVMLMFAKHNSYKKFVYNRADYQRRLEDIKHLTLEKQG